MCCNVSLETKPMFKLCNQFVDVVESDLVDLGTTIYNNVYEKPIDQLVMGVYRICQRGGATFF